LSFLRNYFDGPTDLYSKILDHSAKRSFRVECKLRRTSDLNKTLRKEV